MDTETLKNAVLQELETLRTLREELQLKVSLGRAELRSEWERLEVKFQHAHEEWNRTQEHSQAALRDIEADLRTLLQELKRGYEGLRRAFHD